MRRCGWRTGFGLPGAPNIRGRERTLSGASAIRRPMVRALGAFSIAFLRESSHNSRLSIAAAPSSPR